MSSKAKTRYLAEKSIERFIARHPLFYFWTNSFAGEGVHDKAEAERRAKPLKDYIKRRGGEAQYFWEPHPGGHGWHLHWITNLFIRVDDFRPWMVKRGWGQQMRVERVEAAPARWNGHAWHQDERNVRRVVLYLVKYITKNLKDTECDKKKVWSCTKGCKAGTVKFSWCPWIKPGCFLHHYGKCLYIELYGKLPKFTDFRLVEELGVGATNWLETDPWWMPSGP